MYRSSISVLFTILISLPNFSLAQNECTSFSRKERKEIASQIISEILPNEVVAIRLQGFKKQIEELDRLISSGNITGQALEKLEARRMDYVSSTLMWYEHLKNAFAQYYDQSKVEFYLDFDQSKMGQQDVELWLDENGQPEKRSEQIHPVLYLVQGSTAKRGLEAFMIRDRDFNPVCSPIPTYYKTNNLSTFFLTGEREMRKKAINLARALQKDVQQLRAVL